MEVKCKECDRGATFAVMRDGDDGPATPLCELHVKAGDKLAPMPDGAGQ